jgi:hypothetical protein
MSEDKRSSHSPVQINNEQQVQFLEKKLQLAEEKNDALKNLITSKDDEIEKSFS